MIDTTKIPPPSADYVAGYAAGWTGGNEAAYDRGVEDERARTSAIWGACARTWRMPTQRELKARRSGVPA